VTNTFASLFWNDDEVEHVAAVMVDGITNFSWLQLDSTSCKTIIEQSECQDS